PVATIPRHGPARWWGTGCTTTALPGHAGGMTDQPTPTGESLEQLLERVAFADPDPRVQRLKHLWEQMRDETRALFERASKQRSAERLEYHRICGTPNAEDVARAEAGALRQLLIEEREQRLTTAWAD